MQTEVFTDAPFQHRQIKLMLCRPPHIGNLLPQLDTRNLEYISTGHTTCLKSPPVPQADHREKSAVRLALKKLCH